jgi:hypothetical protein
MCHLAAAIVARRGWSGLRLTWRWLAEWLVNDLRPPRCELVRAWSIWVAQAGRRVFANQRGRHGGQAPAEVQGAGNAQPETLAACTGIGDRSDLLSGRGAPTRTMCQAAFSLGGSIVRQVPPVVLGSR